MLALTGPATFLCWQLLDPLGAIIPFSVGHFFLFCNVFRIHRTKELIWAGVALLVWTACAMTLSMAWWWPFVAQTPITIGLILWEMRGPYYHGIFANRINRRLEDYLQGRLP